MPHYNIKLQGITQTAILGKLKLERTNKLVKWHNVPCGYNASFNKSAEGYVEFGEMGEDPTLRAHRYACKVPMKSGSPLVTPSVPR